MKVTLTAWAARHFEQPPVENTLRIWARQGRIVPTPVKIGRTYYVEPTAQHITEFAQTRRLVGRLRAA